MNRKFRSLFKHVRAPVFLPAIPLLLILLGLHPASAQILAPGVKLIPVAPGFATVQINATSFSRHSLVSLGATQYIAYYNLTTNVTVGRRALNSTSWEIHATTLKPSNPTDAHDVVSIGIGSDGYLHCSWGMHAENLHYARSSSPWSLNLVNATMTGEEHTVTYPQFFQCPNGDVLFHFREGASGAGDTYLNRWSSTTHSWTNVNYNGGQQPYIQGLTADPSINSSAYPNFQCIDSHTNLVVTWVWRESASTIETCHDTLYARSPDYGVTWLKYDGTPYTLPITKATADNIWPIDQNHTLINQNGQCIDTDGRPVIAQWWSPQGTGTPIQYNIIWNDGAQWRTNQIGNRVTNGDDPNTWPVRPVIVCDKANNLFMVFTDPERGNFPTLAWTTDPDRAIWNFTNLTSDNMGNLWEPSYDPLVWERDGKLDILYQRITGVTGGTPISVLEFDPAVFLAAQLVASQTFTWTNTSGGNWSKPANWQSNTPPSGGSSAAQLQFTTGAPYVATNDLFGDFLLNQLSITNSVTNDLTGGSLVFSSNSVTLPSVAQSGVGATRIFNDLTLGADTSMNVPGNLTLAGQLSGPGGLFVSGAGTLTLTGSNTYAGPTTLSVSTVTFANHPIGGTNTLSLSGNTLRWLTNCADDITASRTVNLAGTVTLDPNGNSPILTGRLTSAGGITLQSTAGGTLTLAGNNSFSGTVTLNAGSLIAAHPNALGTSASLALPGNSSTNSLGLQGGITLSKPLVFSGRQPLPNPAGAAAQLINLSGTNTFAGNITCTTGGNQYNIESAAGQLIMSGTFSQTSGTGTRYLNLQGAGDANWTGAINNGVAVITVVKSGGGTWTLSGNNTYTGTNLVTGGTLLVNGRVGAGAMIVVTNATLGGRGVIQGPVTIQSGATLAPGPSLSRFTVNNTLTLQSATTTFVELNAATLTNDSVICTGPITYAGTLLITNLAGTLQPGATFTLFTAPSSTGNFDTILNATPGYDTHFTFNPTNGQLRVASSVATTPPNIQTSITVHTLQITWPPDHTGWRLQAQTNDTGITTNWFDLPTGATNTFSTQISPTNPMVFYRLIYP